MFEIDYNLLEECLESRSKLLELLYQVKNILKNEEKFLVLERDEYAIIGDLHGDFKSLEYILKNVKANKLIFLGDYIDRGDEQLETMISVLILKLKYPNNIFLLRGNHEPIIGLEPYPHDFPLHLSRYEKWVSLYKEFLNVFQELPYTILIKDSVIILHGGLPINLRDNVLDYFEVFSPSVNILEQILWNDPSDEIEDYIESPRGAGYLFGRNITMHALKISKTKMVIRAHEPCHYGYKFNHENKVLTIFSRKGKPYFNKFAAYLELDFRRDDWYRNVENYINLF